MTEAKRKPGRPKKVATRPTLELKIEVEPEVKLIHRYISNSGVPQEGALPSYEVEAYVKSFLDQGFRLSETHFTGENPQGMGLWFILVRD